MYVKPILNYFGVGYALQHYSSLSQRIFLLFYSYLTRYLISIKFKALHYCLLTIYVNILNFVPSYFNKFTTMGNCLKHYNFRLKSKYFILRKHIQWTFPYQHYLSKILLHFTGNSSSDKIASIYWSTDSFWLVMSIWNLHLECWRFLYTLKLIWLSFTSFTPLLVHIYIFFVFQTFWIFLLK